MKRHTTTWIVLAAICTLSLGLAGTKATNALKGEPTTVAVVDLNRLIEGLKEKRAVEASLQSFASTTEAKKGEMESELKAKVTQLDFLEVGSDEHRALQQEIVLGQANLKAWVQLQQAMIARENADGFKRLYDNAQQAIGEVAQSHGIDLVLTHRADADFKFESFQELSAQINDRKVIWASGSIDITDAVIVHLNNAYDAAQ